MRQEQSKQDLVHFLDIWNNFLKKSYLFRVSNFNISFDLPEN